MKPYGFRAAGIVAAPLQTKSNYVYFRSATLSGGAVDDTIIVKSQGGGQELILQPGQGCSIEETVTDWLVYNSSGVGQIDGVLLFGRGHFTDNRPSGQTAIVGTVNVAGTVDVVDGGKARTLTGKTFMGYIAQGAVAAQLSHTQIWNPLGSGKNLVIEAMTICSTAINTYYIRASNAALPTLGGSGTAKKLGAVNSSAELRATNNAAMQGMNTLHAIDLAANTPFIYACKEPIVCPPGYGLICVCGIVNTPIDSNFEWYEEPI